MSRFGGIPVEGQQGGGRFGGVPVEAAPYQRPSIASLRTGDDARNALIAANRAGDAEGAQVFRQLAERLDREASDPARQMDEEGGFWGELEGQLASAGSTVDGTIRGLKQQAIGLIGSGAAGMLPGPASALQGVMSRPDAWREYDRLKREQSEAEQLNESLNERFRTGQVLGYAGQAIAPGMGLNALSKVPVLAQAAPALSTAARAFMPTTLSGAAANGAVLGALQPINSRQGEGERVKNAVIGGSAGLLGQAAAPVVGGVLRAGRNALDFFTDAGAERAAGGLLRQFADDEARILAPQADAILGRAPTLAEATLDPGIAQFQRVAQSQFPNVGNAIATARSSANQARVNALEGLAGTEAQRAGLLRGVQAAEDAAYGAIRPLDGVDVAPVAARIDGLLAGGAGKREAVRTALTRARDALFKADGTPETSVDALLGARQNIGDMLSGLGDNASAKLASSELIAAREALDDQIRRVTGGGLDAALDARRVGMRPINEMDTVASLLQRTTGDVQLPGGQGNARGFRVGEFIRNTDEYGSNSLLDRTAQRGAGFRRADAESTLSPQALETVRGVRAGLLAQQAAEDAARISGSPTAQLQAGQRAVANIGADDSVVANLVRDAVGGRLGLIGRAAGADDRLARVVQEVLTDPQRAQEVLRRLPPKDRVLIEQRLAPYIRTGLLAGAASANQ
jgi:hypothetical protein